MSDQLRCSKRCVKQTCQILFVLGWIYIDTSSMKCRQSAFYFF